MEQKNYIVYGKKVIKHILETKPNLIDYLMIDENKFGELEIPNNVKIFKKNLGELSRIVDANHQGYIGIMKEFNYSPFNEMMSGNKILVLDRIQDPHNFGAIIRSATLFGYKDIIMLDHNQCPVTPTVSKTSAGTLYDVRISRVSNLSNAIKVLQKNNYWVYTTYLSEDSVDINEITFEEKNVIIVGNEGDGVLKKLASQSDFRIKIDTKDAIDSLNVSVATGIVLFAATLFKK